MEMNRSFRKRIRNNSKATSSGCIVNNDLLTVRIDVSIVTHLVTGSISEIRSGLVGSDVTKSSLAEFVLRVEFADDG